VVEGRLWGVVAASSKREQPFPEETESQIGKFTELVATAIANAESRAEITRLLEEQAALRRVATLVAGRTSPEELFAAVADEVTGLLGPDVAVLARFEPDGTATCVGGGWGGDGPGVGEPLPLGALAGVQDEGRPVRVDDYVSFRPVEPGRSGEIVAGVSCPIIVDGRVWGVLAVGSRHGPLPATTEQRLVEFTELVGTAIANAEGRAEITKLLEQQAALRQVATLVAEGVPPDEVVAAVADEIGRVLDADATLMVRLEPDGATTVVAKVGEHPDDMAVGSRWELEPRLAMAEVLRTGCPARRDDYSGIPGAFADVVRRMGIRSSVAIPVIVEGRIWGALGIGSRRGRFPADTEQRMASFTELAGTAITNAQSRAEISRLLEEQAALQRVATLVARGPSPVEVSTAVAAEVAGLLGADDAGVCRYEPEGSSVLVVGVGDSIGRLQPGTRWQPDDLLSTSVVWRTGSAARLDVDRWERAPGPVAAGLRQLGLHSVAASPIVVDGRLWGAVMVWSKRAPLPADTEERLANFTELVAMAIGNAENRAELAASRARIVAASDETRRRIERDLHDGAQQRLVSLALELRFAQDAVPADLGALRARIGRVADELTEVLDGLREISRGIHPAILSEGGLRPALRTLARRAAVPVELDLRTTSRFADAVEVAAYYVLSEALTNTAKHGGASHARVVVEQRDDALLLCIDDDGAGGADPRGGSGLIGLRDRVEALGGSIVIESPVGSGTSIRVTLPAWPADDSPAQTRAVSGTRGTEAPRVPGDGRLLSLADPASS
jgi:signal transduction histidine kinase